jgi:hypothetical protein
MATKKEIRNYAEANGITREEARQHFINEAKQKRPKIFKTNAKDIVAYYWAYKGNDHVNGFEFSNMTMQQLGFNQDYISKLGAMLKDCVDDQVKSYVENTTVEKYGLERDAFAKEEYNRMIGTARELNNMCNSGPVTFQDVLPHIIVFVCAVSTCVSAGLIEQDEWNGDSFMKLAA